MSQTHPKSRALRVRSDVLAGLTTSFALVPECIAFALVAHLNPLMGLYGAFIICTLTALFGGRPGTWFCSKRFPSLCIFGAGSFRFHCYFS